MSCTAGAIALQSTAALHALHFSVLGVVSSHGAGVLQSRRRLTSTDVLFGRVWRLVARLVALMVRLSRKLLVDLPIVLRLRRVTDLGRGWDTV